MEKLQRARGQIKTGTPSQPILSVVGPARIMVGNWSLSCKKENELHFHNSDGQQVCAFAVDSFKFFICCADLLIFLLVIIAML